MSQIEEKRESEDIGKLHIKITRDMLMTWTEDFVRSFNHKEKTGVTNIIAPCLSKVGQNCFEPDNESFTTWLDSLSANALYKSMLKAHTALTL